MQNEEIDKIIEQLKERYQEDGQDLLTHLKGLLYSRYEKYWEYIHLDTLLSLQNPLTEYPDELIFITYHQITELYFKMVLHELELLRKAKNIDKDFFKKRLYRLNWYFAQLIQSFDLINVGLEQDQFMKFRSALHPASGFQSVQYRKVEICSTSFINLLSYEERKKMSEEDPVEDLYNNVYWKKGATDKETGKKTLTLKQFEHKYDHELMHLAKEVGKKNLYSIFSDLPESFRNDPEIISAMKKYDTFVNINWPLAHYKYVVSYLKFRKEPVEGTGGTNWQKYLPPRFQKRIFFPELWNEKEIEEWGKSWVEEEVLSR